jgi:hypothetical protein
LVASERGRPAVLLAEKLLAEGDADAARRLLARRLAEPDLSRAEVVIALEAAGRASARSGDPAAALDRFERALTLDPLVALSPDGGPAAAEAFSAAQARLRAHGPLVLEREGATARSTEPHVTVRVRDPLHLVTTLSLHARHPGGAYVAVEQALESRPVATVELPPSTSSGPRVDWFLVALDANRGALQTLGTADAPLELTFATPQPRWYRRGWVWATIGAATLVGAAAIGVGVYFGTRSTPPVFPIPTQ